MILPQSRPYFKRDLIEVETTYQDNVSEMDIEVAVLSESVSNIINNAIEALQNVPGRRKISIGVYTEGDYVGIKIGNNGPPIEDTNSIFNRGYSSKGSTGIGLDVVKKNIEALGGKIDVIGDPVSFDLKIPYKNR